MVQAVCRGEEFSIDVFCDLDGRCLAAIPRTMIESKGGESIKGMTIKDPELIEFGARVVRGARGSSARRTSSASASRTASCRSPTSTRASAAASRCRRRRARAIPELALALANGEQPEPRLGDFREGVVMTRFFSQVILEERDGHARAGPAGGGGARGGVRTARRCSSPERCCSRGCGSRHEARHDRPPRDRHAVRPSAGRRARRRRSAPAALPCR